MCCFQDGDGGGHNSIHPLRPVDTVPAAALPQTDPAPVSAQDKAAAVVQDEVDTTGAVPTQNELVDTVAAIAVAAVATASHESHGPPSHDSNERKPATSFGRTTTASSSRTTIPHRLWALINKYPNYKPEMPLTTLASELKSSTEQAMTAHAYRNCAILHKPFHAAVGGRVAGTEGTGHQHGAGLVQGQGRWHSLCVFAARRGHHEGQEVSSRNRHLIHPAWNNGIQADRRRAG